MKKTFLPALMAALLVWVLSACGTVPGADLNSFTVQSSPRVVSVAVTTVTPEQQRTPTPNQVQTAMAIIAIDGATSTAGAAATGTAYAVTTTSEAQATNAFWVGVTLGVATERGNETKVAQTQVAGTQQADWKTQQPPSQTAIVATQQVEQTELKSKIIRTWIWNVGGSMAVIGFAWLFILALFDFRRYKIEQGNAKNLQEKTSAMKPDSQGRFPIIPSASLAKNETLLNPNLMHRAQLDPAKADDLSTEQALANTASKDKLEAVRSITSSPAVGTLLKKLMKDEERATTGGIRTHDLTITKPDQPLLTTQLGEIVDADWRVVENWDGKGNLIPCGVNKNGLAFVNIDENDHYGLFGLTGEGKSRGWLRPFLASLLVSGHRAIILGKTGDFWMFDSHPNVNLIPVRDVTEKTEARRYADYLHRMVREMNQRDAWLTSQHQSTWKRAGRENTFIVLDEIGNALEQMARVERDDCMRWIASLVKQGRKNGFNVITASQRAVGFKNIVEQMSRVVFRLSDEASSRIALGRPGAEDLPQKKGKFFAKFDTIDLYGSFMPTDEQLIHFLHSHPVKQHEPLDWIDGTARDVEETEAEFLLSEQDEEQPTNSVKPAVESAPTITTPKIDQAEATADGLILEDDKIVGMYLDYLTRRVRPNLKEIQNVVLLNNGGSYYNKVRKAITLYEGVPDTTEALNQVIEERMSVWSSTENGSTAKNMPESPIFGANPA